MKQLELSKIVRDKTIYPRNGISDVHVGRLVSALKTGVTFPPLTLEAKSHRLVDGWHRYDAYQRQGVTKVDVEQRVYNSEADLFADAVRLNAQHGEPLDQYSIRSAIIKLTAY